MALLCSGACIQRPQRLCSSSRHSGWQSLCERLCSATFTNSTFFQNKMGKKRKSIFK